MRPTSSEWPVLAYTSGLNIGATGVAWITAAAEGVDWTSAPVAVFGTDYGPALGPAGPDTEIFLRTPGGGPPCTRGLSIPDAAAATLTDGWTVRAVFETPSTTPPAVPEVFLGGGHPALPAEGGFCKMEWMPGPNTWQASQWDGAAWVAKWAGPLGASFTMALVHEDGSTTVKLYVNNVCQGETGVVALGAPPAEWLVFGAVPAVSIVFQDNGVPAGGQDLNILGWLVGPAGIRPMANAGPDKVLPLHRVLGFDGGASYDPDNGTLSYEWKLVRAPAASAFVYEGTGAVGASLVEFVSTGIVAEVVVGDILLVEGGEYKITGTIGADTVTVDRSLPVGYSGPFVVVLQALTVGGTTRYFALTPDRTGLYVARLEVTDEDGMVSTADLAVANVVGSTVPLRVPLDMGFLWNYIGDFWQVVENKEWAQDTWVALARIVSSHLQDLWNIDFDKSLATTQNVVMRRWLSYPPRLDLDKSDRPEFHDLRSLVWGDVKFSQVTLDTGNIGFFPYSCTLSFQTPSGAVVDNVTAPPFTTFRDLPDILNTGFAALGHNVTFSYRQADPPITLSGFLWVARYVLTCSSPDYYTAVFAPYFPGSALNVLRGSQAYSLGNNAVLIDDPPLDLDGLLSVGDVLNLGGRSYRIAAVSSARMATVADPVPPYSVRLVLKLDEILPDWILVGADPTTGLGVIALPWEVPSYWKTEVTDWIDQGLTAGDRVYVERRMAGDTTGTFTTVALDVYGAGSDKLCTSDPAAFYPEYSYTPAYVRRYFYLPVGDEVLDVPTLQEAPNEPPWIMEQHLHYELATRRDRNMVVLNHRAEPPDEISAVSALRDRTDAEFLPDQLWAEISHIDNRDVVEANFGRMVNAWVQDYANSDSNYLSVVTALWLVYSLGPTPLHIERAVGIMSGVPYSEAAGTVLDVVTEFLPGRTFMLIRDTERSDVVRSYVFPTGDGVATNPETGAAYAVGDAVERFALLVSTQLYFDYIDDPDWWIGLRSVGVITEPEKVHRFGVFLDARYLNIELVSKIINFVLDFKKTHTFPVFSLLQRLADTFSITDEVQLGVTLTLKDHLWDHAAPPILDYPRLGSGIRVLTSPTGDREDDLLFRLVNPGNPGTPPITMSLRAAAAPAVVVLGNDITVEFIRGVTTAAGAALAVNGDPGASALVVAYHPTGATGTGALNEEYGPVIVNHRGMYQTHFDDQDVRLDSETTCYVRHVSNAPTTELDGWHGPNPLQAVLNGTDGITHRVTLDLLAVPLRYFHDGATPAASDVVPRRDWLEVRTAAGAFRCEGYVVGHGQDVGGATDPTDYSQAANKNRLCIQVDPSLAAPQAGDTVVLYQGPPNNRFMNWLDAPDGYGPIPAAADIYLGSNVFDNIITGVVANPAHPDWQVQVAGAGGAPPRFFRNPLIAWDPLRVGDDYFVYYDSAGGLTGIGVLLSVDASDLATIRLQPDTNAPPMVGGYFRVIRKPVTTFMTPDFRRHLAAFGPQGDNLFLRQSVTPTSP